MAVMAFAQAPTSQVSRTIGRFVACENMAGGGFYWVDTTSGKLWFAVLSNNGKDEWIYVGQPKDAKPDEIGTYVPRANKNGGGLFILNTSTGEGWWAMPGQEWKAFGKPNDERQLPPAASTNRTPTKAAISINPN